MTGSDTTGGRGATAFQAAWGSIAIFLLGLAGMGPTLGDSGLTYDEPAYRYSQQLSLQWWQQLAEARSVAELDRLLDADALLYHWPYARHGINFHPPLSGQLNLLSYVLTRPWLADIAARRLATTAQFAAALALLFGFLARRDGVWAGAGAAGALAFMPRVVGQARLIDTDLTGMLIWLAAALLFWKALHGQRTRRSAIGLGILVGLAFVQKMGAFFVVAPLVAWLVAGHLPPLLFRGATRWDWLDGMLTSAALLGPLGLIFLEVHRLAGVLPPPQYTDLFFDRPPTPWPGAVLLVPLVIWLARQALRLGFPRSRLWGERRPALEAWSAILGLAPAVAWLANPLWWRETLPRLAHYYQITTARRGVLPDIQNLYFGTIYEYSLPWHSGWVLIAITVPLSLLVAGLVGLVPALARLRKGDRFGLFVILLFATPPSLRLLPTPAHDGVRLILPCFAFLAILCGWGGAAAADLAAGLTRWVRPFWVRLLCLATILVPAAVAVARVHPYELSYYNPLIGGPRGAWRQGFELAYWYDAMTPAVVEDLNRLLPQGALLTYANQQSNPLMVLQDLQALGLLRGDLIVGGDDDAGSSRFPYMVLLTHDSKASSFTRLLFAMRPWYALEPRQLDGLRVLTVADPVAVSRAWALQLLCHGPAATAEVAPPLAPDWIRRWFGPLARLWGDGLTRVAAPLADQPMFEWAEDDPEGLRQAAAAVANGQEIGANPPAQRLLAWLKRDDRPGPGGDFSARLLSVRPEALREAAQILIARGEAIERVLEHPAYTDPDSIGGYLDADLPDVPGRLVDPARQR